MTTVKSVIVPTVGTTLTSAYTNTTGASATLKAVNATGIGDPDVWTVDTGTADEWTYFGSPLVTFAGPNPAANAGNTHPFPIQLSADRVLLLWTPAHMHAGGGNDYLGGTVLHTQIVEYTGTRYRAGPIVNLLLPDAVFNSQTVGVWTTPTGMGATGQSLLKGLAITPTKVVIAYRSSTFFKLLRLNISGNSLDQANVVNFDLSGATSFNSTTAFAFDLALVRGSTTQIVVGGSNGTNWSLQSLNVPDSGAITVASALFNTALAHTTFHFAIAPLNGTAVGTTTTYVVAANTSTGVTLSVQNFSYDSATVTFAAVGSAVTVTNTSTLGIAARPLSTDGTANAVVCFFDTGNAQQLRFLRQTNLTQAQNSVVTATLPSSSASRALRASFNWGTDRAVFVGTINAIVVFDNAGTATPLVTATDTATTTITQPIWYPFNSRPLYTYHDDGGTTVGKLSQFIARTGMATSISVGVPNLYGNYLPYGHNYGHGCAWSSKAQCWFMAQGGKLYALSNDGVVLSEIGIYDLLPGIGSSSYLLSIKSVDVAPSGKVFFITDTMGTGASYYGQYWASVTNSSYGFAIDVVSQPTDLAGALLLSATSLNYHVAVDLTSYTDASGLERALALFVNASTNANIAAARFDGGSWSALGNTSISVAALNSGFHFGARPNFVLMQDTPANTLYPTGLWRCVGAGGTNSALNMAYQAISATSVSDGGITSITMSTVLNTTVANVYPAVKSQSSRTQSVAMYDNNRSAGRYYFVIGGRLFGTLTGLLISGANTMQFMNSIASKYAFVVSPCSTNTSAVAQIAYVFDAINPAAGPRYTLTATSGNGWTTLDRPNGAQLEVFGTGVNSRYTVSGPDTSNLVVTVSGGGNDFYVLPVNGQTIDTSKASSYRNTDVYLIPNNYSVKLSSTLAGSLSAMLTVVEEV